MLRETPSPKSPTMLTNEQVEAWMRKNPDKVKHLDSTDYDHSISQSIRVKDRDRQPVTPLSSQAIKEAASKQQRQEFKMDYEQRPKDKIDLKLLGVER